MFHSYKVPSPANNPFLKGFYVKIKAILLPKKKKKNNKSKNSDHSAQRSEPNFEILLSV